MRKVPQKERPLIALVALDDDVRLGILPNSVKLVTTDCEMKACKPTEFKFQRGEVFLMHPALVHYGCCAYKAQKRSLRAGDNRTRSNYHKYRRKEAHY